MDHKRFDTLIRMIISRRTVSGAVAGTIVSLLGLTQVEEAEAAPCPKGKQRCGKKCISRRGCCKTADCRPKGGGTVCRRNRCVCPRGTKRCGKRCLPKAAACPPKPDAFCPGGGSIAIVPSNVRLAQTFIEPNGGLLTAAAFRIQNEPGATAGLYELRLKRVDAATGIPQGATLAVAKRSAASVSETSLAWVRFDFLIPRRLQPGQQYALVLSRTAPERWSQEIRTPALCPGGALSMSDNGSPFTLLPERDTAYRTFVKG